MNSKRKWVCCQIGAREHYAIPRALGNAGHNCQLLTDAWVPSSSPFRFLKHSLRERHHPDVPDVFVKHWTLRRLTFECLAKARRSGGWPLIIETNRWFQRQVLKEFDGLARSGVHTDAPPILFSYSYAALELFQYAKAKGWTTILGQIDPGEEQAKLANELARTRPALGKLREPMPARYWQAWREECALADHIVVNSNWSRQCLEKTGIDGSKISVLPLAFEAPAAAKTFHREYPLSFSRARPLRALFLGQAMQLKGIAEVLDAFSRLHSDPVELWVVGRVLVDVPKELKALPSVRWFGQVPRSDVHAFYRQADVFLFPTWSDGFGLTQLEAVSWKLPVIASRFCGQVVEHGANGLILEELSGDCIARQLSYLTRHSARLAEMSSHCEVGPEFSLPVLGKGLSDLTNK